MASLNVERLITNDNIGSASLVIKDALDNSKEVEKVALTVLKVLSTFLSKIIRCQSTSKSNVADIFIIANECCKALSKTWKCNHNDFMLYVYNICEYLIKNDSALNAKKLTIYFINLKQGDLKNIKLDSWSKNQKAVLVNTLSNFANSIFSVQNSNRSLVGNEDSIESWWLFMMSICELNNYENISLTFQATALLFSKSTNVTDVISLGSFIFKRYRSIIENSYSLKGSGLETQKDLSLLITMIDLYFYKFTNEDLINTNCTDLLYFLKGVLNVTKNQNLSVQIELILNLISLLNKNTCDQLETIICKISNVIDEAISSSNKELILFTTGFIHKSFKILTKNPDLMSKCDQSLFKLSIDLLLLHRKILPNDKFSKKQFNWIVNRLVCSVLFVVISFGNTPENLKTVFKDVWTTMNFFFNCENMAETSINELNYGVDFCTRAIIAYKKAGFMYESKELSRLMIVCLRKIDFIILPPETLKGNVNHLINNFVETSSKSNFSYECLTYLLALANDTNPLFKFEDKFHYWCKLKILSLNSVDSVTVYDIINRDDERQLDETVVDDILKWPFSTVTSLNHEVLLLKEIQSYLKYKELMKVPVLSVYRKAVSVIKSKPVLARILCCTTESAVQFCDSTTNLNKFQLSLKNMIKIISSKDIDLNPIEKNLLLGDLNYYLARCEICYQRKQAEKLVVDVQASQNNDAVPVVEDPLDTTNISCEFSFMSYSTQDTIMSYFKKAYDFWTQASLSIKLNKNINDSTINSAKNSMYFIKTCGYLYKLFKNVKYAVTFWQLLLELSELVKNAKYKIIAFSELLCTSLIMNETAINEMKQFVKSKDIQKEYYYLLFQIALCKNKLYNLKFDESRDMFNSIDESDVMKFKLVHIQYSILHYLLQLSVEKSDDKKLRHLIDQFELCLTVHKKYLYSNIVEETVNEFLLLDLSLMISRMFCQGKDVRYARFYCSFTLKMSQELHLPIRLAELLILQAQTDELCINAEDLADKLNNIETILELSCKSTGYDHHPDECTCVRCNHVEYMISKMYATIIRSSFYRLQGIVPTCIVFMKDAQEMISKLKKKFNSTYVTEITECDLFFSHTSVRVLSEWSKKDKALKYADHGIKYIQKSYKPHGCDLSFLSLTKFLTLEFNDNDLKPSNVTELYQAPTSVLADCRTPQAVTPLISPPPIGWKVYSPFSGTPVHPIPKDKIKKIIFQKTPETGVNKDKYTDENNPFKLDKSTVKKGQNKIGKTPGKFTDIPTIIVEDDDEIINKKKMCKNITNDKYLKVINSGNIRKKENHVNSNLITPLKSSIPVFCDDEEVKSDIEGLKINSKLNSIKNRRKSYVNKNLFGTNEDSSNGNHNSQESDDVSVCEQDSIVNSSNDNSPSIIEATIIEDSDEKDSQYQLANISSRFADLNIKPSTSLQTPVTGTSEKHTRRNKFTHNNRVVTDERVNNVQSSVLTPSILGTSSELSVASTTKKYTRKNKFVLNNKALADEEISNVLSSVLTPIIPSKSSHIPVASTTKKYTRKNKCILNNDEECNIQSVLTPNILGTSSETPIATATKYARKNKGILDNKVHTDEVANIQTPKIMLTRSKRNISSAKK